MAIGDVYEVVIKGHHDGQETNNVLHFKAKATDTEEQLADLILDCVTDSLLAAVSSEWTFRGVYAKRVYPTTSVEAIQNGDEAPGTGGAGLPPTDAAVISLRTGHSGRSGHGRMYIPAIPEASQVGGTLESAAMVALASFITCLAANFIDGSEAFDWGVVSRKEKAATPGTVANWFFPLTSAVVNPDLGTMRSRKKGRGI